MKPGEPMRRTPLARSTTPMQRGEPMQRTEMDRRPTERLRLSAQDYAERRDGVNMRDWGRCIIEMTGVCTGRAQAVHHRMPRGMGGSSRNPKIHQYSRLISVCDACHRWAESHREEAERFGWIIRRGDVDPETVPTRWHGRWTLLTDDGMTLAMDDPPPGELL